MRPGQSPKEVEILEDSLKGKSDLWLRLRAYLYSVCFLTILTPGFWQCIRCEYYTDLLLGLINTKIKGQHPPFDHFGSACEATMRHLIEYVRDGHTLKHAFDHRSSWLHFWPSWSPPASTSDKRRLPGHDSNTSLQALGAKVKRLEAEKRAL